MKYIIDTWCKIIDINTQNIVLAGKVYNTKKQGLLSFDNKFFFREKGTSKYFITDNLEKIEIKNPIPNNYILVPYRGNNNNTTADVFRDYDITELDEEVKELVYALNKIDGITTTGSCSGHGKEKLYVNFIVNKDDNLKFLSTILIHFTRDFILKDHMKKFNNSNNNTKMFELQSIKMGEAAYKAANKLAKYINALIK